MSKFLALAALALALAGCTGGTTIVLPQAQGAAQTAAQADYAANHPDEESAQAPDEVDF